MPSARECHARAARCEALAQQASDEVTRRQLLQARDSWIKLAEPWVRPVHQDTRNAG